MRGKDLTVPHRFRNWQLVRFDARGRSVVLYLYMFPFSVISRDDIVAERSKALASGASSKERRFESCRCHIFLHARMQANGIFFCTRRRAPRRSTENDREPALHTHHTTKNMQTLLYLPKLSPNKFRHTPQSHMLQITYFNKTTIPHHATSTIPLQKHPPTHLSSHPLLPLHLNSSSSATPPRSPTSPSSSHPPPPPSARPQPSSSSARGTGPPGRGARA